jgi:hypothetical protein
MSQPIDADRPPAPTAPLVRWMGHLVADMLRAVTSSNFDQQPLQSSTNWGIP